MLHIATSSIFSTEYPSRAVPLLHRRFMENFPNECYEICTARLSFHIEIAHDYLQKNLPQHSQQQQPEQQLYCGDSISGQNQPPPQTPLPATPVLSSKSSRQLQSTTSGNVALIKSSAKGLWEKFRPLLRREPTVPPPDSRRYLVLFPHVVINLQKVIEHLLNPERLAVEGLFRRHGLLSRQEKLRSLLVSEDCTVIPEVSSETVSVATRSPSHLSIEPASNSTSGVSCSGLTSSSSGGSGRNSLSLTAFTPVECAATLKKVISELATALIPEAFVLLLEQVLKLQTRERKIEVCQILFMVLPMAQRHLLFDIIHLLHSTARLQHLNKMTPASLATLFAPALFHARETNEAIFLKRSTEFYIPITTFFIETFPKIFEMSPMVLYSMTQHDCFSSLVQLSATAACISGHSLSADKASVCSSGDVLTHLLLDTQTSRSYLGSVPMAASRGHSSGSRVMPNSTSRKVTQTLLCSNLRKNGRFNKNISQQPQNSTVPASRKPIEVPKVFSSVAHHSVVWSPARNNNKSALQIQFQKLPAPPAAPQRHKFMQAFPLLPSRYKPVTTVPEKIPDGLQLSTGSDTSLARSDIAVVGDNFSTDSTSKNQQQHVREAETYAASLLGDKTLSSHCSSVSPACSTSHLSEEATITHGKSSGALLVRNSRIVDQRDKSNHQAGWSRIGLAPEKPQLQRQNSRRRAAAELGLEQVFQQMSPDRRPTKGPKQARMTDLFPVTRFATPQDFGIPKVPLHKKKSCPNGELCFSTPV